MGNFQRPGGGFNRGFGGGKRFGGSDGGRPAMFKATCSECGDDCQLPFKPSGERPVFCSNCFAKQNDDGGSRPSRFGDDRRERSDRPRFEDRQMHEATCATCGNTCQVPFRPTGDKPVYCNNCFDRSAVVKKDSRGPSSNSGELMDQFKILNNKIDKLIKLLAPELVEEVKKPEAKKEVKEVVAKAEKPAKEVKEKKTKPAAKKAPAKKKK